MKSTSKRAKANRGKQTQLDLCQREVEELRTALAIAREQEKVAQECLQKLETANQALQQKERLLEVTAIAAHSLLTTTTLDAAINHALQIVGEALDTDRVGLFEVVASTSNSTFPHWRALEYEWKSPGTVLQHSDVDAAQVSYDEIPEIFERLHQRQTVSYFIEEVPEPFRSHQIAIGVKSTHLVPIFVQGQFWGGLGLDDCHEAKRRSITELSVLKIAADCIGSAIQRDRTQQDLLQAEQARTRVAIGHSQDLERHYAELQQALEHEVELRHRLAESEKRYRTLFELSNEGIYRFELQPPVPIALPLDEKAKLAYHSLQVAEANPAFIAQYGFSGPEEVAGKRFTDFYPSDSEVNLDTIRELTQSGYRLHNAPTEELGVDGQPRHFLQNVVCDVQDGYLLGGWGTQTDITELRQAQQALLQAEQERAEELAKANEELRQRDRLLSIVAEVTKDLLKNPQVEAAIEQALQRIGEAAGVSRMLVMQEKLEASSRQLQHCVIQEWSASGIPKQTDDSVTKAVNNDEYAALIDELHAGQSIWHVLEALPEPIRTQQAGIGVKSTGAVPIFIAGKYFGCVAFDDCVNYHQWTPQEIDVLTSSSGAIGAALHRKQLVDHLVEERTQAEQARAIELAQVNNAVRRSINALTSQPSVEAFLEVTLKSIAEVLEVHSAMFWKIEEQWATLQLAYQDGQVLPGKQTDHPNATAPGQLWNAYNAAGRIYDYPFCHPVDDPASQFTEAQRAMFHQLGVRSVLGAPVVIGDRTVAIITVRLTHEMPDPSPLRLELMNVLAGQAALAMQMSQLAEEAKQTAILEERNRMAQDIHDTLAQSFTSIGMQLQAAARFLSRNPEQAQSCLAYAQELTRSGLAVARQSVWALQSEAENYCQLDSTLQRLAAQQSLETAIPIEASIAGTPYSLPADVGMNLLRIGQEALNNAIHHAQAQTILVTLTYAPNQIQLQIQDDGQGFDLQLRLNSGGFGLIGMQQRSDRLKGELMIISHPGQGTEVRVTVPIESENSPLLRNTRL